MDAKLKPNVSSESLDSLICNEAPLYKLQRSVHQYGVFYFDEDHQTPRPALHLATRLGQDKVVNVLLDSGADINGFDQFVQQTALQVSIVNKQESCFRILVQRNADVNLSHPSTELPIFLILQSIVDRYGDCSIDVQDRMLRLLLEAGAEVNAISSQHDTVLMYAINKIKGSKHMPIFNTIMNFKPNLNLCNGSGQSPLHTALNQTSFNIPLIKALVEGSADVTARDVDGNTVLHYLVMPYHLNVECEGIREAQIEQLVTLLSTNGLDINTQNYQQMTPLFMALACKNPDNINEDLYDKNRMADTMIECGGWFNVYSYDTTRFTSRVANYHELPDVTPGHTLLNYAHIKAEFNQEWVALCNLCEYECLIDLDVDVDMRSIKGQSFMHRVLQVDFGDEDDESDSLAEFRCL